VVDVAKQAKSAGVKTAVPFLVSPGSDQIYETIKRDDFVSALEGVGATVLANACGPCIGQWKRDDVKPGEKNSILNSFNRNFPGRNDGNAETLSFIASPEIVMALGLAGRLSFNPLTDALPNGATLKPPAPADEVPPKGFVTPMEGYIPPAEDGSKVEVIVDPKSPRLQLLQPFQPWDGRDFVESPLLLKAKGKCTTDHISPAGKWLAFRGHLDKISDNMFTGAIDAWSGQAVGDAAPRKAREFKSAGRRWVVVGDVNYGEGSSREHAAMSPRYLGAAAILVRSFARIHETNLKKQGVLPLTFANADDYEKVQKDDRISIVGLKDLAPGKEVDLVLHHADGKSEKIRAKHSMTTEQIEWFKAGSALNLLKATYKG
jgi:aconitate hydratase